MGKEIITFEDIEIEKNKFYRHKTLTFLKDEYIEKVLMSNKISFGEKTCKYFIGYMYNNNKVKSLYIMLAKASAFVKIYDGQTKWMYLLIEDIILSGIKSALISKKNLISSLYIIKIF